MDKIYIGYIFGLSKLHFGLDFDLTRYRLSQDNSGPDWAKSAQVHVEPSRSGPSRIESVWAKVEPSHSGPKSSRVNPGPSRVEWPILSRLKSVGADVEPSWPRPMPSRAKAFGSSRAGPGRYPDDRARANVEPNKSGRCRAEQARPMSSRTGQADVEPSRSGPISSLAGQGRYWVECTRADIESSRPGPMSRRADRGQCRAERARADVESSGMSSRAGPGSCRVV